MNMQLQPSSLNEHDEHLEWNDHDLEHTNMNMNMNMNRSSTSSTITKRTRMDEAKAGKQK
jgi:hypothetical protein